MDQINRAERKFELLDKRAVERQLTKQCRKTDQELIDAKNETIEYFQQNFKENESLIIDLIQQSQDTPKEKLPIHFDNISKQILSLQKYVSSSTLFLRSYDIKIYQKIIQELSVQLKDTEMRLMPKKKFGFRTKKGDKIATDAVDSQLNGSNRRKEIVLDENYCGFRNEEGKHLKLLTSEVLKKDVSLSNLKNCIVHLHGAPSTLHMSNITNCKIFAGPVSTSIFADNCMDSTFFISCQQLRLHSSRRVDIYLHVTSRAIMEDCAEIQIAPYSYSYEGIEEDYLDAGLDRSINNWECVDDFNWLNTEKKSPHWCILQPEKRNDLYHYAM